MVLRIIALATMLSAASCSFAYAENLTQKKSLSKNCATADFSESGEPYMFPTVEGVAFGISSPSTTFKEGEYIGLVTWIDNQTNKDFDYNTCEWANISHVESYNTNGAPTRKPPVTEEEQFDESLRKRCFRTFNIKIPPHTCAVPDGRNISLEKLPRGDYILVEDRYKIPKKQKALSAIQGNGLRIRVE